MRRKKCWVPERNHSKESEKKGEREPWRKGHARSNLLKGTGQKANGPKKRERGEVVAKISGSGETAIGGGGRFRESTNNQLAERITTERSGAFAKASAGRQGGGPETKPKQPLAAARRGKKGPREEQERDKNRTYGKKITQVNAGDQKGERFKKRDAAEEPRAGEKRWGAAGRTKGQPS